MPPIVTYNYPTPIRFGPNSSRELPEILAGRHLLRPLVITDNAIVKLSWFDELMDLMAGFELAVFHDMGGNPVKSQVTSGVKAAREHHADCVIAIGGGAPVDVAKAVALMLHHPGDLFDYEDGKPDARQADGVMPYVIAIPTTSGTGSEVGRSSVISDDVTHAKKIIFSPRMLPNLVLADPCLTLGLPAAITAAVGFDALTHLIEAYLAPMKHPMCDGIGLEGIKLVARSLESAVKFARAQAGETPEHIQARADMLNASMMGAVAFQKGLGVNHSCAHALSTVCDTHHGLANALMLETCMRFNFKAVPGRFEELAAAAGRSSGAEFIQWLCALRDAVGIPSGLAHLALSSSQLEKLIDVAFEDGCHQNNPVPVTRSNFADLFNQAAQK